MDDLPLLGELAQHANAGAAPALATVTNVSATTGNWIRVAQLRAQVRE